MKGFIHDPDYLKKNILPRIEKKINDEISALVESAMREKGLSGNVARESLYKEFRSQLYQELGSHSSESFFEKEYRNALSLFQKNFPYHSMDHFIESHMRDMLQSKEKAKKITGQNSTDNSI